jgi:hypothetical protein
MKKRPISITVIAWFFIVTSVIFIVTNTIGFMMENPIREKLMAENLLPIPVQYAFMYIGSLVSIACGIGMLKRKNWSRLLYVYWTAFALLVGALTFPLKTMFIPGTVFYAVVLFFLYREGATEYFTGEWQSSILPGPKISLIRKIISIIFYVIGAFFLFAANLMCFVNFEADIFANSDPTAWMKLLIVGVPFVLAVLVIGIGSLIRRSTNRKRDIGVILISASCFGAFSILKVVSAFLSSEAKKFFAGEALYRMNDAFSDYITGGASILVLAFLGVLFYQSSTKVEAGECETTLEENQGSSENFRELGE